MSSEEEWCEFNDMPKATCAHCREPQKPSTEDEPELGVVFAARYRGNCVECPDDITPGDHIVATEVVRDGFGDVVKTLYAHYGCMRA